MLTANETSLDNLTAAGFSGHTMEIGCLWLTAVSHVRQV